jgi:V8-like Glu-specific endopeptidase
MDLNKYYQQFTNALIHAFGEGELTMLAQFRLNVNLDNIVGQGPLQKRVFELIGWCDREGRIDELFVSALAERPNNPKLKALAATLAGDIDALQMQIEATAKRYANKAYENPQADDVRKALSSFETNGALQALVVTAPHLAAGQDVVGWTDRLNESRARVCSIALQGAHVGTGFLIGDDRVMTNSHVVAPGDLSGYDVVFDFIKGTSRAALSKYRLADELSRSGEREYDFAILRLDQVPAGNRGFFRAKPCLFNKIREPVSVLGHPNGDPLSFAYGVVFDNNSFFGRVAYTANTAPGSSGSPVFSENWDLVALHHHGETNVNNHGVPMKSILGHLQQKNLAGLLTPA